MFIGKRDGYDDRIKFEESLRNHDCDTHNDLLPHIIKLVNNTYEPTLYGEFC